MNEVNEKAPIFGGDPNEMLVLPLIYREEAEAPPAEDLQRRTVMWRTIISLLWAVNTIFAFYAILIAKYLHSFLSASCLIDFFLLATQYNGVRVARPFLFWFHALPLFCWMAMSMISFRVTGIIKQLEDRTISNAPAARISRTRAYFSR